MLNQLYAQTGEGFIFVIDEWDCVFRIAKERGDIQKNYLDFLRGLFKGSDYVELAYMTGILPIKKYGEHKVNSAIGRREGPLGGSAINIFSEYSMTDPKNLVYKSYHGTSLRKRICRCGISSQEECE